MRGSTPIHVFELPFETNLIEKVRVTYSQNRRPVLSKEDFVFLEKSVEIKLSQEETLLFTNDRLVEIQLKVLFKDGTVQVSDIMEMACDRCLDNEVII